MSITPCPSSTTPTPGVVVFVPADFKTAYPAFATVADAALQVSFQLATLQLNNSCCSRMKDANERELLLNLLTAHITALKDGQNGQPPPGVVGRIDKATEGSVSVSTAMDTAGQKGKDYYAQTQWGMLYWMSTAKYRTAVYIPAPPVCADFNGGIGFPGSFWPNGGPFPSDGGCGC
jgi:hypothetical protein